MRIERRRGVIQEQDLWITDESSRNRYSLLLASAQLRSLAADISLVALYITIIRLLTVQAAYKGSASLVYKSQLSGEFEFKRFSF